MRPKSLEGRRILLVEDNVALASFLEKILRDAGVDVVGPAATVLSAEKLITTNAGLAAALLDVRLHGGEEVWPVARLLASLGVPFVFYTANSDTLPPEWSTRPTIAKPSRPGIIISTLADVARSDVSAEHPLTS